jgi:hypothetical protein
MTVFVDDETIRGGVEAYHDRPRRCRCRARIKRDRGITDLDGFVLARGRLVRPAHRGRRDW